MYFMWIFHGLMDFQLWLELDWFRFPPPKPVLLHVEAIQLSLWRAAIAVLPLLFLSLFLMLNLFFAS